MSGAALLTIIAIVGRCGLTVLCVFVCETGRFVCKARGSKKTEKIGGSGGMACRVRENLLARFDLDGFVASLTMGQFVVEYRYWGGQMIRTKMLSLPL